MNGCPPTFPSLPPHPNLSPPFSHRQPLPLLHSGQLHVRSQACQMLHVFNSAGVLFVSRLANPPRPCPPTLPSPPPAGPHAAGPQASKTGTVCRFQRHSSASCAKHQQLGPELYWTLQPSYHAGGSTAHGGADWAGPPHHAACGWGLASSASEVRASSHVFHAT